jgi:hypothetical protein
MSVESARAAKFRSTFTRCRQPRVNTLNDYPTFKLSDRGQDVELQLSG